MIIYMLTNKLNGKRYIGQTCSSLKVRVHYHIKRGRGLIHKALNKYGVAGFEIRKLVIVQDREELNYYEPLLIEAFKTLVPDGYNLTEGGWRGWGHTEEAKEKIRQSTIRMTEEGRNPFSGSKMGKQNAFYGKRHSEETKKHLSQVRTGRKFSDATRRKMSESSKKRWEERRKLS